MRRPARILVIDDDPDVRTTIQWILEAEGFVVSLAANGQEGLDLLKREPADVVLTDIFMPEKEGIETIAELRRAFPQLPIFVVSGGGSARHADYALVARELGAQQVFRKPLDPQILIDALHEALGTSAT